MRWEWFRVDLPVYIGSWPVHNTWLRPSSVRSNLIRSAIWGGRNRCGVSLIDKLVHDNEVLMKEVAELDAQLRQVMQERDAAIESNASLTQLQNEQESTSDIANRLLQSMETQVAFVRAEREETDRQHAADKEHLRHIFAQLEAHLALAREERNELQARADRERRAASKRIKELEERIREVEEIKDRTREACEREKEVLSRKYERRVAGLRLEKKKESICLLLLRGLSDGFQARCTI